MAGARSSAGGRDHQADVVIVGGGTGGCAAALAALSLGRSVVMTEETSWIGGQLTSQAVPPDEHPWIERFGCTATYRQFRDRVRRYYRRNFPLSAAARATRWLNPGGGDVSRLCHDPRVGVAVLHEMLAPHLHTGRLTLLPRYRAEGVSVSGDRVDSVTVRDLDGGDDRVLTAPYVLDATETGELLELAGVEHVTGAESQGDTGEPHAVPGTARPLEMQAFTYCFAMDHLEGERHVIDEPEEYAFWAGYRAEFWPDRQLSWVAPDPKTLEPVRHGLFPGEEPSLWRFRRIVDRGNFEPGTYRSDVTLVNWPQSDYWLGPLYGQGEDASARHRRMAKQLSLSLLYWMQTEAPRPDGGCGYPGLRLRQDVTGTADGLAMAPYVRESRRIRAEFTVVEQHVSAEERPSRAERFEDSVGIGCYRIDLHPSTGGRSYIDLPAWPFQIPLGSLIPVRVENLLPACKNIGVTHITQGCYRLHPVEWNVGEAAGALAAYCLEENVPPRAARTGRHLSSLQALLTGMGVELGWPTVGPV
jgi:hypothetical protein